MEYRKAQRDQGFRSAISSGALCGGNVRLLVSHRASIFIED